MMIFIGGFLAGLLFGALIMAVVIGGTQNEND